MHSLHRQAEEAGNMNAVQSSYILASSSCLYNIYIINKVSTESGLLISAF